MQSIANKIRVRVIPRYLSEYSKPVERQFLFAYHIIITNNSDEDVQLLARHWHIFDSTNTFKEVKGEGVVGKQPIILSSEVYDYQSFCELKSDMGMMWGTFLMKNLNSNEKFEVKVPVFQLIQDCRLN